MTHLSKATCARIAELMPRYEAISTDRTVHTFTLDEILGRDFLISAFGEEENFCDACRRGHPYFADCDAGVGNNQPAWRHYGEKLLQAYWTSGVEGVEELLLELLKNR